MGTENTKPSKTEDLKLKEWVGPGDGRQVLIGQHEKSGQWFVQTPTNDGKGLNFYPLGDEYSSAMKANVRAKIKTNGYSTVYDQNGKPFDNRKFETKFEQAKGLGLSILKKITPVDLAVSVVSPVSAVQTAVNLTKKENPSIRPQKTEDLKLTKWVGPGDGRQVLIGQHKKSGQWFVQTPTNDGKGLNFYPIGNADKANVRAQIKTNGYSTVYDKNGEPFDNRQVRRDGIETKFEEFKNNVSETLNRVQGKTPIPNALNIAVAVVTDPVRAAEVVAKSVQTGNPYTPGERIGDIGAGDGALFYVGFKNGHHIVQSKTNTYEVREGLYSRDEVRKWVINQVKKHGITSGFFKPGETPVYANNEGIRTPKGYLVFKKIGDDFFVNSTTTRYPIPKNLNTKEAVNRWVNDQVGPHGGIKSPLYPGPNGLNASQQRSEQLEKNGDFTNTKFVPLPHGQGLVSYIDPKTQQTLEATIVQRQQYMGEKDGWQTTGYMIDGIRRLQEKAPNSNQTAELDGRYVVASVGTNFLLKNVQGEPFQTLEQAKQRTQELLQWRGLTTQQERENSVKNGVAGVGSAFTDPLLDIAKGGHKALQWLTTFGQTPKETYEAIDRFHDQGRKVTARQIGVDPATQAFQRTQTAANAVMVVIAIFKGGAGLVKLAKNARTAYVTAQSAQALATMQKNGPALVKLAETVMENPGLYKFLSKDLKDLVLVGLAQSKNPNAGAALLHLLSNTKLPAVLTTVRNAKATAPVVLATAKGSAYALNYFSKPENIKGTARESVAGLLKQPGFYIAVTTGLAMGGLANYGTKLRQMNGASMAEINKIMVNDTVFWAALGAVSNNIVRALDGEKVLTPNGIQKSLAAAINSGADTGAVTGFLPNPFVPLNTRVYTQTVGGSFIAKSFGGFKDPNLWKQAMVRFGLGAGVDTANQLASANGDIRKINLANAGISGVSSALYPVFMAGLQKFTIHNSAALEKIIPQLFERNGAQITSRISDTVLPHTAYLSRYLAYGLMATLIKREINNNGNNSLTQNDFARIDSKMADYLNSPQALKAMINSPEFKAATAHLDSMPPVLSIIAVGAYQPSGQALKDLQKLSSYEAGIQQLYSIQIPAQSQGADFSKSIDNQLRQLASSLKVSYGVNNDIDLTRQNPRLEASNTVALNNPGVSDPYSANTNLNTANPYGFNYKNPGLLDQNGQYAPPNPQAAETPLEQIKISPGGGPRMGFS